MFSSFASIVSRCLSEAYALCNEWLHKGWPLLVYPTLQLILIAIDLVEQA